MFERFIVKVGWRMWRRNAGEKAAILLLGYGDDPQVLLDRSIANGGEGPYKEGFEAHCRFAIKDKQRVEVNLDGQPDSPNPE